MANSRILIADDNEANCELLEAYLAEIDCDVYWKAIEDPSKAGKAAAILAIAGLINVPIIKFSVDWWSTLHQPASVLKLDGPAIHPSMLVPLLIMAVAFTGLFLVLHMHAMNIGQFARSGRAGQLMFDLGPHSGFIIASYVCAIAILAVLIGWIYLSRRKLNQQMAAYEEQGLLRKSSSSSGYEN